MRCGFNMFCEYPYCQQQARHADTILDGFTCDEHFSQLDCHTDPKKYKEEMLKIERLERKQVLGV